MRATLGRSAYWQLKGSFDELRSQLKSTEELSDDWDTYGAEAPNDRARILAATVLEKLEAKSLIPTVILPSVEGGIGVAFAEGETQAGIEIYNTGEMVASIWTAVYRPTVWELTDSSVELEKAIDTIRVRLTA